MIYSSQAASASDLWDDTLWEGFLRAGESGFQLMPWGNMLFKDMLSPSIEILTQRPAGGWERHLNTISGNTAFEGRLVLLFHVHTEQGSTARRHRVSNPAQVSVTSSVALPSRHVSWKSALLLVPVLANTESHLGCLCPALRCLPILDSLCQGARLKSLCQNIPRIETDPDRGC